MSRKLRWGILSTANIGRAAVIPAIQHSQNGEVLAVASRDAQKGRDFAARTGIGRSCGSYEELLAASDIDAVYISLPNSLHREWAIKAAEAGKHILCEKPLALNAAECEDMASAARRHGVVLMEAFMYRFHPQTEKVLALLSAGALGELRLIHSAFTFRVSNPANIRLQAELGGGSLMDVGCYCINLSRTVVGVEPVEVQATANWSPSGVDAQMAGWLRFSAQAASSSPRRGAEGSEPSASTRDASNGPLATFDCALTLERREYYELGGTEGSLLVPAAFLPGAGDTTMRLRQGRKGETVINIAGVDEYCLMVEHFADCVLKGKPLRYPPSEAAANMRVIEALYRSARNGGRSEKVT